MFPQGDPEILDEARVANLLSRLSASFRPVARQVMEEYGWELANEFIDGLKEKITEQSFPHTPLSPAYLASKRRKGLDQRVLIATQEYISSFVAERVDDANEAGSIKFRCGVRDGIHSTSGMTYARLAKIHEYGKGNVPPRPHWRPQGLEYRLRGHEIARQMRHRIAMAVRDGLQS